MKVASFFFKIIFLYLLLNLAFNLHAQEYGSPIIQNYTIDDFPGSPQNWDIEQNENGIMYFGNSDCLLEFDGINWETYYLHNRSRVGSIHIDTNGIIYLGGAGEFGCLLPNSYGKLQYVCLTDSLDILFKEFNIFSIFSTEDGVYFCSTNYLFKWAENKLTYKKVDINYAILFEKKIYLSKDGTIIPLDSTNKTSFHLSQNDTIVYNSIISLPNTDNVILSTKKCGLFLYDKKSNTATEINTKANKYIKSKTITKAFRIDNERIAVSTAQGGIIIINNNGHLLQIINEARGLGSDYIYMIFADKNKNLWAAHQKGISFINLSCPVQIFDIKQNLDNFVLDVASYRGTKYVAAYDGLYILEDYKLEFENDNHIYKELVAKSSQWDLLKIKGNLFVGGELGLSQITEKGVYLLDIPLPDQHKHIISLAYSEEIPNKLFCGSTKGLVIIDFEWSNNEKSIDVKKISSIPELQSTVFDLQIHDSANIWFSSEANGLNSLYYTSNDDYKIFRYDTKSGLPISSFFNISNIGGNINILTDKGAYKPIYGKGNKPNATTIFAHDTKWGKKLSADSTPVYHIIELKDNKYFLNSLIPIIMEFDEQGNTITSTKYLHKLVYFNPSYVELDSNGLINLCTPNSLLVYDPFQKTDVDSHYHCLLRKVIVSKDSIIFAGNYNIETNNIISIVQDQTDEFIHSLKYKDNTISFEFSAPPYESNEHTLYTHILVGYEKEWSKPTEETKVVYTNLHEGDYIFKVKAININGIESETCNYSFSISPPLYRTPLAFIIYFLLFILLIYLIISIYTANLKRANIKLEETVFRRTQEILDKNIEINQQKDEIIAQRDQLTIINEELEKLSIVARETDNSIIIMNEKGEFLWTNPAFSRMHGYSLDEYIKIYGNNIKETSRNKKINDIIQQVHKNKKAIIYQSSFVKEKRIIWLQTTLTPILDETGNISKLIAIDTNISNLKETQAINRDLTISKEVNEIKRQFLSNMSHEMRTPMNGIIGMSEFLISQLKNDKDIEVAKIINSSALSLMDVIKEILEITKIGDGQVQLNSKDFNLHNSIDHIASMYAASAKEKNLELNVKHDDKFPEVLFADEHKVSQVLSYLVSNAIKFTEQGSINIQYSISSPEYAKIEVIDTGIGLSKEKKELVFTMFSQADFSDTRKYGGVGLGLSIAKQLVDLMEGEIDFISKEANGSNFWFTFKVGTPHSNIND